MGGIGKGDGRGVLAFGWEEWVVRTAYYVYQRLGCAGV